MPEIFIFLKVKTHRLKCILDKFATFFWLVLVCCQGVYYWVGIYKHTTYMIQASQK